MPRKAMPADERVVPVNVTLRPVEIEALERLQAALGGVSRTQAVRVAVARVLAAEQQGVQQS